MSQLSIQEYISPPFIYEQRCNDRFPVTHMLAITKNGTGQILNIGREGLAFGCLYPHTFEQEFTLDILDARGNHIKDLQVRKVWQKNGSDPELPSKFELVFGIEFIALTTAQKSGISFLIEQLEEIDYQLSSLL